MPGSPDTHTTAVCDHARACVQDDEVCELSEGWRAACSPAGDDDRCGQLEHLSWLPASVPGTAAGALRDAGLWQAGQRRAFDEEDWWFRTTFSAEPAGPGEEVSLRLDGIATVAEVRIDGELVVASDSMFARHAVPLGEHLRGAADGPRAGELTIRCRALAPLLAQPRRPRARWPTRLVSERNLRFYRTMLLGRAPGFAPEPAAVGPWRGVRLHRHRRVVVQELMLRPRMEGRDGVLAVRVRLRALVGTQVREIALELDGPSGGHRAPLRLRGSREAPVAEGELRVPAVERWWPHTHGLPALHRVRLLVRDGQRAEPIVIHAGRTGFRELSFGSGHDALEDGLELRVNGVRIFARGAVWTPVDPVGLAPTGRELREALLRVREGGMNMLRIPGTAAYETADFHELCDELGILVWQDFMFANFDYPIALEQFRRSVTEEARAVLAAVGGRPSLAVLCGNSEVEQQVAMLGLDPALGRGELFGELLPGLVRESGVDSLYVPSAPSGGELPFRPDRGVANYYGVGGYRRPLEDARRAGVRFAAECLAFSNLPCEPDAVADPLHTGVPRDAGAEWDFTDVRDHYLELLYGLDARALAASDRERYLELSQAVSGEVMAETFGEWRRAASPCAGALVLWLRDLLPGAGWGVIDHLDVPKLAYHHLRRALAPVAVWTIDEGLGGIVAHVANDLPQPLTASLRVALYRGALCIEEGLTAVELTAHSQCEWNVETIIGHFVDASWAYRFGPPAQDAIVVSLERRSDDGQHEQAQGGHCGYSPHGSPVIAQAVRFPAGRPLDRHAPAELGLTVESISCGADARLELASRTLAHGVRVHAPGFLASDNGFFVEPGGRRVVTLRALAPDSSLERASVQALNMRGRLELAAGSPAQ